MFFPLLTALVGFLFQGNVIPSRYYGSGVVLFDITKWSVTSTAELRVRYTNSFLESTDTLLFRLDCFVSIFRRQCSSNGDFCFRMGGESEIVQCFV